MDPTFGSRPSRNAELKTTTCMGARMFPQRQMLTLLPYTTWRREKWYVGLEGIPMYQTTRCHIAKDSLRSTVEWNISQLLQQQARLAEAQHMETEPRRVSRWVRRSVGRQGLYWLHPRHPVYRNSELVHPNRQFRETGLARSLSLSQGWKTTPKPLR
jgi:hypothetical protein